MRRLFMAGATLLLIVVVPDAGSSNPSLTPPTRAELRAKYFGAENVDEAGNVRADKAIMSWTSAGGFAMALAGHVVLLDAYIHKGEDHPNYVPSSTDELVGLDPEAVFIGHGHFDHAASAGEIVARTGAVLVGTPEHCDQTRSQAAAYQGRPVAVQCIDAVDRMSEPGSEVRILNPLGADFEVAAVKHLHSASEPPDGEGHETSLTSGAIPDAGSILLHPPGTSMVTNLFPFTNNEGGSILYQFRVGEFTLTWHDTSGPLRSQAPEVLTLLSELPPTDVEVGSVLGFNDPTNGMRDIVDYTVAIKPKVFFPNHHDFVTEYGMGKNLEGVYKRELAKREPQDTEIRWLYDPYDYVRPSVMTFDIHDPLFQPEG